ncbi:MAG TPA: YdcF family protein [Acidocella sp.]|jgi:uncharacterized SAM-binding protein YcdF (DUF218 family)|nr:YdcF family protein [Acidocella sp.]
MPRRRRRRGFSPLRLLTRIVFWIGGLWLAGFALFLIFVFTSAPPNPLPSADGIVALTGGDDRVSEALALLADRQAPRLLISGAGRGTYLGDFTKDNAPAATQYALDITIGHMADSTHGNAVETASWVAAHHMRSLIIVTADYHMPRALQEMHQALPDVALIPYPVRPPAMHKILSLPTLRMLAGEYSKYLAVRAGLGWLAGAVRQSVP